MSASWSPPPSDAPISVRLPDSGWTYDVQEFDGPRGPHIVGHKYITLTHNGPKAEGAPVPGELVWTEAEAWHRYHTTLSRHVAGATQIAWRERPQASQDPINGNWRIFSRLYWDTMKEAE